MRCILFVLFVSLVACGRSGSQDHAARMQACNDATSNPSTAITACAALLDDPALDRKARVAVLFWQAQARQRAGDLAGAAQDLDAVIALDPDQAMAYDYRGAVNGTRGDLPGAIRDFDRALALDPTSADSFGNRGKALADSGEHARALQDYSRAIELAPDNGSHRNGRCWSRAILGSELDEALADCDEAVLLAPEDGNNFNSRGFVRFRRGDYADAVGDYSKAIALAPQGASSYYMRGRAKALLGDASSAQDIERGVAGEPGVAARYASYGVQVP